MTESCSCGDKAEVGATVEFQCKTCENVIERFTVKKPLKAAGIAAILAYGGSQFITNLDSHFMLVNQHHGSSS